MGLRPPSPPKAKCPTRPPLGGGTARPPLDLGRRAGVVGDVAPDGRRPPGPFMGSVVEPSDDVGEDFLHVIVGLAGSEAMPHAGVERDGLVDAAGPLVERSAHLRVGHRVRLPVQHQEGKIHLPVSLSSGHEQVHVLDFTSIHLFTYFKKYCPLFFFFFLISACLRKPAGSGLNFLPDSCTGKPI